MALINKGLSTRLLARISTMALVACTMGLATGVARASPTTPCDPEYMDALEARAYMEAQREVSQNQNYILKPDSVLEYTCFDWFLSHFSSDKRWGASCDAYPFSDSCRWGAVFMQPAGSIWGSVNSVVVSALSAYLTGEFGFPGRNYLYGRATINYWNNKGDLAWSDPANQPPPNAQYGCGEMEAVWMQAHCYNFADEPKHDAFYQFDWYKTNDPRANNPKVPLDWNGGGGMCTVATPYSTNDAIIEAFNGAANDAKYDLTAENPWSSTGMTDTNTYLADPVVTHLDLILPVGGPNPPAPTACNSVTPIPTGVCVVRAGWSTVYEDAVCPNPGCYYVAPPGPGPGADPANCPSTTVGSCGP